ncbi:Exopolysaccharide glucosyl ketal-pyruvate-transferase [compost metagenome]
MPQKKYIKKYKLSFIPYFRHVPYFNWGLFERLTGIHVILPTNEVEQVITEINESEKIITAAMHGAILADIYRVPWMRARFSKHGYESSFTSELKWNDWFQSIGFNEIPTHNFDFTFKKKNSKFKSLIMMGLMYMRFKHNSFLLSSDSFLKEIDSKLDLEIQFVKNKYNA